MAKNLSSSPESVTSFLSSNFPIGNKLSPFIEKNEQTQRLELDEFADHIKKLFKEKDTSNNSNHEIGEKENKHCSFHDKVTKIFNQLMMTKEEIRKFQYFDGNKKYTRNLIATDHRTFTLVLMCWNPGEESPIHDHPCDGCWMRVYEGSVEESRYKKKDCTNSLVCSSHFVYKTGQLAYITDSMGYHKICNSSLTKPATTMHLYIPPIQKCKIWPDQRKASSPSTSQLCFHSEYGQRIN